ncbi:hypothetical protein IE077_000707 [Cardiosporidium cionae]|uniref:H/ACA ribonucleoprotein complex non-core subunit NAF1 n=1 Tax=Cardiosporidium cionae TaxID=476202 RepID=A0ABQ7J6P8_9APIC|nr:hypothetical protein IE077_000707 [Cardiosporidium cionae]|eukprot:KAF8819657.1 hypothetical protein IE077_000707 [Cardiosporidium cionae]
MSNFVPEGVQQSSPEELHSSSPMISCSSNLVPGCCDDKDVALSLDISSSCQLGLSSIYADGSEAAIPAISCNVESSQKDDVTVTHTMQTVGSTSPEEKSCQVSHKSTESSHAPENLNAHNEASPLLLNVSISDNEIVDSSSAGRVDLLCGDLIIDGETEMDDLWVAARIAKIEYSRFQQTVTPETVIRPHGKIPSADNDSSDEESEQDFYLNQILSQEFKARRSQYNRNENEEINSISSDNEDKQLKLNDEAMHEKICNPTEISLSNAKIDEISFYSKDILSDDELMADSSAVSDSKYWPPIQKVEVENLPAWVSSNLAIDSVGTIHALVEGVLIVQSNQNLKTLDLGSILCLKDRVILGPISDTFGPVTSPFYVIFLENEAKMHKESLKVGTEIYSDTTHSSYIVDRSTTASTDHFTKMQNPDLSEDSEDETDVCNDDVSFLWESSMKNEPANLNRSNGFTVLTPLKEHYDTIGKPSMDSTVSSLQNQKTLNNQNSQQQPPLNKKNKLAALAGVRSHENRSFSHPMVTGSAVKSNPPSSSPATSFPSFSNPSLSIPPPPPPLFSPTPQNPYFIPPPPHSLPLHSIPPPSHTMLLSHAMPFPPHAVPHFLPHTMPHFPAHIRELHPYGMIPAHPQMPGNAMHPYAQSFFPQQTPFAPKNSMHRQGNATPSQRKVFPKVHAARPRN